MSYYRAIGNTASNISVTELLTAAAAASSAAAAGNLGDFK